MKKKIALLLTLVLSLLVMTSALVACNNNDNTPQTRTVVDMTGKTITIPEKVNSYVDLWLSHAPVMAMLDNEGKMKGCSYDPDDDFGAWFYEVYPSAKGCVITEENISTEELVQLGVDVVFWENGKYEAVAAQLNEAGIATVNIRFSTYDEMKKSIKLTAEVLGTDYAKSQSEKFCNTLDSTITEVSGKVANIAENDKTTVMAFRDNKNYRSGALETMEDCWITLCGGINATAKGTNQVGNVSPTVEQIVEWDPDVMFFRVAGCAEQVLATPDYQIFKAVSSGKVYDNIQGMFYWDACTPETILQLKYISKLLYPEIFAETNMENEVRKFYKDFFNYDISDTNINNLLTHQLPTKAV